LCNSATNLGSPGPNAVYGFGIVNAQAAINTIGSRQSASVTPFFEGTLANGDPPQSFTINNTDTTPLKITLCWLDPAGNPAATNAIVNNLDFTVQAPDGTINFPYVLNPSNPSA